MNDRELLELAAKAAGNGAEWYQGLGMGIDHGTGFPQLWSPLTNDGDALRLAVALDLSLGAAPNFPTLRQRWVGIRQLRDVITEEDRDDKFAATRRAIVRAAAEIGKAMP